LSQQQRAETVIVAKISKHQNVAGAIAEHAIAKAFIKGKAAFNSGLEPISKFPTAVDPL
jgi:hypothetical protein